MLGAEIFRTSHAVFLFHAAIAIIQIHLHSPLVDYDEAVVGIVEKTLAIVRLIVSHLRKNSFGIFIPEARRAHIRDLRVLVRKICILFRFRLLYCIKRSSCVHAFHKVRTIGSLVAGLPLRTPCMGQAYQGKDTCQ